MIPLQMFATDRISTRTLNSVLTHDPDSVEIAKWFSKDYNLTWGQNLAKKYFDMIGLHNWMDEGQEVTTPNPPIIPPPPPQDPIQYAPVEYQRRPSAALQPIRWPNLLRL